MKQSKEEKEFFKYFDVVEVIELEEEPWVRYLVPLSRYEKREEEEE